MLKRFSLITVILAVTALLAVGVMAQVGAGVSNACRTVDGQVNTVVRIGVPDDAVADGSGLAGCRVIHDGNGYVLSPAVIGDLGVIRRGVRAAVSVFGIAGGGAVDNFGRELQLCLRGTGSMVFINTAVSPRLVSDMPAVTRDLEAGTYTCTFISGSGVAVLVNGPAAPSEESAELVVDETGAAVQENMAPMAEDGAMPMASVGATPLSGCRVTTTAMVRLRDQPNTSSDILTRLPYQFSLQATARTDDWVQVIWQDRQGWVSATYLNLSAGCTDE